MRKSSTETKGGTGIVKTHSHTEKPLLPEERTSYDSQHHIYSKALKKMPDNAVLSKMLERLYSAVLSGPAINCRPHSSRQRIDLSQLSRLDTPANQIIAQLLSTEANIKLVARAMEPPLSWLDREDLDEHQRASVNAWQGQQSIFRKLKVIAEDAATYQQETGVNALCLGFPIISFPPKSDGDRTLKRVLSPVLFVPIDMAVRSGRGQSLTLSCAEGGINRVLPNPGLLVWIEKQTGRKIKDLFEDENGEDPWREIMEVLNAVCSALELPVFSMSPDITLTSIPKTDSDDLQQPAILPSAVLGLFPLANQGLIKDTTELAEGPKIEGPLASFVTVAESLAGSIADPSLVKEEQNDIHDEFLVSAADPCQARAVRLARTARGLVVHGPPGTGKSQTITNIIGDHLARGQRVLFVCDKRTALDVVRYRLEKIGLGGLCAIVHDPQRDQKNLYMGIRSQLDALAEMTPATEAERELARIGDELKRLHAELKSFDKAVCAKSGNMHSLHDLVGMWLEASRDGVPTDCRFRQLNIDDLSGFERVLKEIWSRAEAISYGANVWVEAAGLTVEKLLEQPQTFWRSSLINLAALAKQADELRDTDFIPHREPFSISAKMQAAVAEKLSLALQMNGQDPLLAWVKVPADEAAAFASRMKTLRGQRALLEHAAAVPELDEIIKHSTTVQLAAESGELLSYLQVTPSWHSFLHFGRKSQASKILRRYGLPLSEANARKLAASIERERARRALHDLFSHAPLASSTPIPEDVSQLLAVNKRLESLVHLLVPEEHEKAFLDQLRKWITAEHLPGLAERIRHSSLHAEQLEIFFVNLDGNLLFSDSCRQNLKKAGTALAEVLPFMNNLVRDFATLESLLRINLLISQLPAELGAAVRKILTEVEHPSCWQNTLVKCVLEKQISRTLQSMPELHRVDSQYYSSSFERYRTLKLAKQNAVKQATQSLWLSRQQQRLLATTGSRLNGVGAELRRRLFLRGSKAMRLRQVVAAGANIEGSDPLFDVCPVWMASPETVAQVFPRLPIFDVLIFDEASQCRLEEALPVLTRAKRVVIAGDPKQLPPTRFFETTVANTTDAADASDEQGWFEIQQRDIEDLLSASLNLEIEQSFLDVHYRSRNADLISFSNDNFYDGRLQPIPAHPSNRAKIPPLRLTHVAGIYEEQTNRREAEEIVGIVRELLVSEKPPSIGIACFNLSQRDLISELLGDAAESDPEFAERYHAALKRSGVATFEGLFVKNLESVQGDERDHIIISTTYGPDSKGKFRRNFGPLNRMGGGRRLNVLITRAREAVHLVTSIPRTEYLSATVVPPGQTPNGAFLLFSYLRFAERLVQLYATAQSNGGPAVADPSVTVRPTRTPSVQAPPFAEHLCDKLKYSSDVYWGNEGFCIDIAIQHPNQPENVTVGVICDGTRYDKTDDAIEWDVFRTEILESQGWQLIRSFSPAVFRDFEDTMAQIRELHNKIVAKDLIAASTQSGAVQ
jgi:hypothetical protein